jgi:hypothetical protein
VGVGGIATDETEKFDLGFTVMTRVRLPTPCTVAVTVPVNTITPDQPEPPFGPVTVRTVFAEFVPENDHWVTVPLDTVHDTEAPRIRVSGVQDNCGAGSTSTKAAPLVGESPDPDSTKLFPLPL